MSLALEIALKNMHEKCDGLDAGNLERRFEGFRNAYAEVLSAALEALAAEKLGVPYVHVRKDDNGNV